MLLAGGAAAIALTACVACTPTPAPGPTPTGFASAEEAFAAAEATYRAYSDSLNARRRDKSALPDPDSFLTGSALEGSIRGADRLREAGLRVEGESAITRVLPRSANHSTATLTVCIDSSTTRVLNENNLEVTPSDRSAISALEIEVVRTVERDLIFRSERTAEDECL